MKVDKRVQGILDSAQSGVAPSREACVWLLQFHETSLEASLLRAVADACSRRRFDNGGIVLGQIGVEIAACPGKCKFCSFGEGHTTFEPSAMSDEDILSSADNFTASGELFALFLMTMHTFDFERLIRIVRKVRARIPQATQIVVNIGDFDHAQARDLKAAGVNGAYHVCRLREGVDTALDPEQRKATIRVIKNVGLDWYYCCEPIGPEHSPEKLADQIFLGLEYGCFQHAAMRRVYVPSAPLAHNGQISELRLAQVTAVVTLATLACTETRSIAVHEPNLLGLTAGANTVYAEAGANPRDLEKNTLGHRGRDLRACKTMLYEAGFVQLQASPTRSIALGEAYRG
ncbi:MAG: radical SAM protein [Kiritimatiellia bacterium]|jgi:biotin synthase|nr:radical SAM protein [Kiritimatiellia bacterium]